MASGEQEQGPQDRANEQEEAREGEEYARTPEELDAWFDEAMNEAIEEMLPPPPLIVEDGVDGEYVTYLKEVAEKRGLDLPCCETDGDGRIVAVSVTAFDANDQPLGEVLRRIAPLRHVKSAKIQESMDPEDALRQPLSDDDLEFLAGWTQIEKLVLSARSLTGRGFERLTRKNPLKRLNTFQVRLAEDAAAVDLVLAAVENCRELREIELANTGLTDAGLASLGQLTNLETIDFSGTKITGEGLRHFGTLTKLKSLTIEHVSNDDEGLRSLSRLPELKELYTKGTLITDHGLVHLAEMESLESLSLSKTSITAHGLEHLTKLPRLTTLMIAETRLGDEAVAVLRRMARLEYLDATDTEFTVAGIEQLRAALPHCNVVCYEPKPNQPAGK